MDENLEIFIQYIDSDEDGYGDTNQSISNCTWEEGFVINADDCDDDNIEISPDADEVCDAIDNNCDNIVDEDAIDRIQWFLDQDSDGYGSENPENEKIQKIQMSQNMSLYLVFNQKIMLKIMKIAMMIILKFHQMLMRCAMKSTTTAMI